MFILYVTMPGIFILMEVYGTYKIAFISITNVLDTLFWYEIKTLQGLVSNRYVNYIICMYMNINEDIRNKKYTV